MKVYVVTNQESDREGLDEYDVYYGVAATQLGAMAIIDPPGTEWHYPTRFDIDPDTGVVTKYVEHTRYDGEDYELAEDRYKITEVELPSAEVLTQLVQAGDLIGVEVFGGQGCEDAGHEWSFGLCDVFSKHSVGSDCNRAEHFLLRPSDDCMTDELRAKRVEE